VVEPSWILPDTTTELSLVEILAERLGAQRVSEEWHRHVTTVVRRREQIDELRNLRTETGLGSYLGSERAVAVLRALISADPAVFLDDEPELSEQIVDWVRERRRVGKYQARDRARQWVEALECRYDMVWAAQAHRFLAASAHLAAGHPSVYRLAAVLAGGDLADDLSVLDSPPNTSRTALQDAVLGDYSARRAQYVDEIWQGLRRRDRKRRSRQDLADRFDDEHLLICATCTTMYPLPETVYERCQHCGDVLLDWPDRAKVTPLAQRLHVIRRRLAEHG
jgi:hypothetical protein